MEKYVILSSGGLDSTVCLAEVLQTVDSKNVVMLGFEYGQNHDKELLAIEKLARYYGVGYNIIDLASTGIYSKSDSVLLKGRGVIPSGEYAKQVIESNGMLATNIPFRNGLFVSYAAAFAMSESKKHNSVIGLGVHSDDSAGNAYADCSEDFVNKMNAAIQVGTYNMVKIWAPFVTKSKADVVRRGIELNVPFELTWSCYFGGDKPCGICGTCIDRVAAFKKNNSNDPVEYAPHPGYN